MRRACDLADVPAWQRHRRDRGACSARVCFGTLARLITMLARADGLVLGRRIFLAPEAWRMAREGSPRVVALLEHELVHVEQYRRLGFLRFLWRYLTEYLRGRWRGLGHLEAYRRISLEAEARAVTAARLSEATPGPRTISRCSRGG